MKGRGGWTGVDVETEKEEAEDIGRRGNERGDWGREAESAGVFKNQPSAFSNSPLS